MVEESSKTKAQITQESRQIKKQFADIKKKQEEGHYSDSFYVGPVLINEQITDQLREFLNMGEDISTLRRLNLPVPLEKDPYAQALVMTERYLSFLSRDDDKKGTKGFLHQLGSRFELEYPVAAHPQQHEYIHNSAAIGAVLVLKAFELQLGESFFDNLRKTTSKEVLEAFNECSQLVTSQSLVEKARSRVKIPEDGQIFLKPFIEEFANSHSGVFVHHVEFGANLAFHVIAELWPKLRPGTHDPQINQPK